MTMYQPDHCPVGILYHKGNQQGDPLSGIKFIIPFEACLSTILIILHRRGLLTTLPMPPPTFPTNAFPDLSQPDRSDIANYPKPIPHPNAIRQHTPDFDPVVPDPQQEFLCANDAAFVDDHLLCISAPSPDDIIKALPFTAQVIHDVLTGHRLRIPTQPK